MKNTTEVINIFNVLFFPLLQFLPQICTLWLNVGLSAQLIHFSQSELFKILQRAVFLYSNNHFSKNVKYCGHGMVLKK